MFAVHSTQHGIRCCRIKNWLLNDDIVVEIISFIANRPPKCVIFNCCIENNRIKEAVHLFCYMNAASLYIRGINMQSKGALTFLQSFCGTSVSVNIESHCFSFFDEVADYVSAVISHNILKQSSYSSFLDTIQSNIARNKDFTLIHFLNNDTTTKSAQNSIYELLIHLQSNVRQRIAYFYFEMSNLSITSEGVNDCLAILSNYNSVESLQICGSDFQSYGSINVKTNVSAKMLRNYSSSKLSVLKIILRVKEYKRSL